MGHFTDEMTRLTGQRSWPLRGARRTFVKDLSHDVAAMKADLPPGPP